MQIGLSARGLERMMHATLQVAFPFIDKPRVETLGLLHKFKALQQSPSIFSQTTQSEPKTPTAFHSKAQGRGAHPGY